MTQNRTSRSITHVQADECGAAACSNVRPSSGLVSAASAASTWIGPVMVLIGRVPSDVARSTFASLLAAVALVNAVIVLA